MAGNVPDLSKAINDAAVRAAQVRKAAKDAATTAPPKPDGGSK